MKNHYQILKRDFFNNIESTIKMHLIHQTPALDDAYFDATDGIRDGLYYGGASINLVLAYYMEDSPYYRDDRLLQYAYEALTTYEGFIHEDGTTDLLTTNFHDPAQTAFHTQVLFSPAEIVARHTRHTELEDKLFDKYLELMRKTGEGLANLGFHTPNHRWIICSSLAIINHFIPDSKYTDAIGKFLMEGIDCDECGEFTERSTGSYNCICDHSLIIWAEFSGDESLYDHVRRNLNLMFSFIEPDDTVNTLNSTRWDNGGEYHIVKYYAYYLMMALHDKNPEFAYIADKHLDKYIATCKQHLSTLLVYLKLHPELEAVFDELEPKAPAKDQSRFLPKSRIARVYKPELNTTMTALCARHPVFFQINYGTSILQLRYTGSFFGDPHSTFRARDIQPIEDGFRLICEESAGYRSTFKEKPAISEWRRMDHSKRDLINIQRFHREINIHIHEDSVTIDLVANGCDKIPTKFEILVPAGGKLLTDSVYMVPKPGDYAYLTKGKARYFVDGVRYFEIDGGFNSHTFGEQMRGSFPANAKKFTLALTSETPQCSSVTISLKNLTSNLL